MTAVTDASLYSLHKELFVQAVTGHIIAASTVGAIIAGHLGDEDGSRSETGDSEI